MAASKKVTLLQGSLDMLVLQSLKKEARHGYAIAKYLKEVSRDFLQVEEGSLYPALHRLEQRGWITSYWGASESNRRAKLRAWAELTPAANTVLPHGATWSVTLLLEHGPPSA